MNPLAKWLSRATVKEREALARRAGTTPNSLHVTAGAYRNGGKLNMTAEFAARIENASDGALRRDELSPVCKACPYAKRCG